MHDRVGQQPQPKPRIRVAWRHQALLARLDQPARLEFAKPMRHIRLGAGAQFAGQVRKHGVEQAQQVGFPNAPPAVHHQTRRERRRGEHMQDVVAVPGHQHRGETVVAQHVTAARLRSRQQAQALHAPHHLRRRRVVHLVLRPARPGADQPAVEVDLRHQRRLLNGLARRGQRGERHQMRGVDHRPRVDGGEDAPAEYAGHRVRRWRRVFLARNGCPHEVGELQRRGETHLRGAVELPRQAQTAQHVAHGFGFLAGAPQLVHITRRLHHLLVADVHGHESDGARQTSATRLHGHLQEAKARRQQPPGARTAALHEILHAVAAAKHLIHVLREHRRIHAIAGESAPHEERPAAAQHAAHQRQVEIVAGGDVRQHQSLVVQDVGKQQVVDVRAVARRVDQRVGLRHGAHMLHAADAHAFVHAMPKPSEQPIQKPHGRVGHVRGDGERGFAGAARQLLARLRVRAFGGDGGGHRRAAQNLRHQGAAVG